MANEDNIRQLNQTNGSNSEVLAAIKDLDGRLTAVEEIILARLNDTRPFEQQIMARINELAVTQAATLEAIVAIREEQAAMRADFNEFRQETNHNFRMLNQTQGHLNNDFLHIRGEISLLENRVEVLEVGASA